MNKKYTCFLKKKCLSLPTYSVVRILQKIQLSKLAPQLQLYEGECDITICEGTVQLTGNVAGMDTTRHVSTRVTCEGTGSPRGTVSKTKTT